MAAPAMSLAPYALACLGAVLVLIWADIREASRWRVLAKMSASTSFVALALALGATNSTYGWLILVALMLGWLGDALLLIKSSLAFMAGLGAFLLSHGLYAAAFTHQTALSWPAMGVSLCIAALLGAVILRWLWPHLPPAMKLPVLAYVVVILGMCVTAAGHTAATGHWAVLTGALMFAASDIAVARDRFVCPGHINRLWGWPAYFLAQLVLAWSVSGRV